MVKIFSNIFYLFLILNFYSCNKNDPDKFFKAFDYPVPENQPYAFNPNSILQIVLPIQDNSARYEIVVENIVGRVVFEKHYKNNYPSYAKFLNELQSSNLYLNANFFNEYDLNNKIEVEDSVHWEQSKFGLNFIINKYLEKKSGNRYFKTRYYTKPALGESIRRSVVKFMYLNKYYIVEDDVGGGVSFVKGRKKVIEE